MDGNSSFALDWLASPLFAFRMDSEFRLIQTSPSFLQFLGLPGGARIEKRLPDFLDRANPLNAQVLHSNEICSRNLLHGQHLVFRVNSSELKVVKFQTSPISVSKTLLAIGRDITQQFCGENDLRHRLEGLESTLSQLSLREKTVLDCVVKGELNKSIAKQLEVTVRAVERIRARLRKKFMAQTSAEMVSKATEYTVLNDVVNKKSEQSD
jgi:DNA-binding CsgD family transcriptional regulator